MRISKKKKIIQTSPARKMKQSVIMSFMERNNKLEQIKKQQKKGPNTKENTEIVPQYFCKDYTSKQKSLSVNLAESRLKCKSFGYESKTFYIQMRNKFHADLINMNRQTYGKNYLYEKRLQISYQINQDALNLNSSPNEKKKVITYYQPCRMRQNYGHLKNIHLNLKKEITLQKVRKIRMDLQKKNKMKFQQCLRRGRTVFGTALLQ